jgi:uncharacterized protein (TIGR04255 family)
MALHFREQADIRLQNPPLVEVICQVRFPPILNITASQPTAFQERIRSRFPRMGYEQGLSVRVTQPGGPPQSELQPLVYKFATSDEQTSISLAADFFALSTQRYTHWADYREDLLLATAVVVDVYQPVYASRIGLRYINRLTRANTQAADISAMLGLLQPELTALMRSKAWDAPQENLNQIVLTDESTRLALRTLYGQENVEPFLVLDFDCFEDGQLDLDGVVQRAGRYHDVIYRAFRWSFRDGAIDVFNPVEEA